MPKPMEHNWLPSFVPRKARQPTEHQQRLMREVLPALEVDVPESGALLPQALFPQAKELWLEIGFGSGEHMLHRARSHPTIGMIGCETFEQGMMSALSAIERKGIANIRLWHNDARLLLQALPEGALARAFVLFPDPWPKKRHNKRRIVNQQTLDLFAHAMKPGGELLLATDITDYAEWMLTHVLAHPQFIWDAATPDAIYETPEGWIQTRYQEKAIKAGRGSYYIRCRRV